MLHAAISCAKSSYPGGLGCGQLFIDTSDSSDLSADLPGAVAKALAEHGWSQRDGEHYCPVHDPAQAGDVVEIAPVSYRPLGDSGWEARIPGNCHAQGMTANVEIRRRAETPQSDSDDVGAPEPVSVTDWEASAIGAFLDALDAHLNDLPRSVQDAGFIASPEWADVDLRAPWLRVLLDERSAVRALAPDSREHEDPFYRPGGVYVSANGWFRFTCRAVAAGIALGVEERLKDGPGMGPARRNVWRSVRAAGCDHEVDPETGEPLEPASDEE